MDYITINFTVEDGKVYEMEAHRNGHRRWDYIQDGRGPMSADEASEEIKKEMLRRI